MELNQTDKISNIAYFSTLFLAIFQAELKKGSRYSPISEHLATLCLYGMIVVNLFFVGMILYRFGELYQEQLAPVLGFIRSKTGLFSEADKSDSKEKKPDAHSPTSSKSSPSKKDSNSPAPKELSAKKID